jgi:hypothetical protein
MELCWLNMPNAGTNLGLRRKEDQMAQHSLRPHRRRALIVDDETSFGD